MCVASNPVYLVQCLFLLHSLFLCVAHAAEASFDKKGLLEAVQPLSTYPYVGMVRATLLGAHIFLSSCTMSLHPVNCAIFYLVENMYLLISDFLVKHGENIEMKIFYKYC